jgi:hypothetical protein
LVVIKDVWIDEGVMDNGTKDDIKNYSTSVATQGTINRITVVGHQKRKNNF